MPRGSRRSPQNIDTCFELSDAVCDATLSESAFESLKSGETFREIGGLSSRHNHRQQLIWITNDQHSEEFKDSERCVICIHSTTSLLPLVEIVPGEKTSMDTLKRAREFFEGLGKCQ